jgi:hypothetical protein
VILYWGFPGSEDYARYEPTTNPIPNSDPGYDQAFGPNLYLDYGLEYKVSRNSTVNLNLYNIMGWFNPTLNKRNFILGEQKANYRSEAASIGVAYRAKF